MLALSNKDETRSFDYSDYSAFVLAIEDIVKAACEARIQDRTLLSLLSLTVRGLWGRLLWLLHVLHLCLPSPLR